jgi:hypothetical protein
MSVSQVLSGTPAGIAVTGGVRVPASQSSTLGPTSFQNQAVTGVLSLTGGNAGGLLVEATVGSLTLEAAGDVVVDADNVGVAVIPSAGGATLTVAVANTNITANSIILVTPLAANAAIAAGQGPLRVVRNAGVGFNITATAAVTATDLPIGYWIVKY